VNLFKAVVLGLLDKFWAVMPLERIGQKDISLNLQALLLEALLFIESLFYQYRSATHPVNSKAAKFILVTFCCVIYSNVKTHKMKSKNLLPAVASALAILMMLFSTVATAQEAGKLTDPEIASAAVVANQNDIDFAAIAKQKSKNGEILKFAETMAKDHKAVIEQAVALVTKLKVTPKDNAVSQKLKSDAAETQKMLRSQSVQGFDKAYIDNEVRYHQGVIAAVETVLIPQATNEELKKLLQNVVPALRAHLEHAQMVQKTFASK
jgi:putative membrane protein